MQPGRVSTIAEPEIGSRSMDSSTQRQRALALALAAGLGLAAAGPLAHAQFVMASTQAPALREQVRAETDRFLATHKWQEEAGVWIPKPARNAKP
jgi:hypothetical protein